MTWFTHAQIFDDLLIVSQKETCCYILKTAAGLVCIDGIWPDERVFNEMQEAIREAGWENEQMRMFLMTHGHIDHVGCGKWLTEHFHVETYLSAEDNALRLSTSHEDGRNDNWKDFAIDHVLSDGDQIACGDRMITVVATPGHTKGCMSFLFPVHDLGSEHMACLFGGATPPRGDEDGRKTQIESIKKFKRVALENGCDVAFTNHTAFDSGLTRIAYSRARMSFLPNIYVLGVDGVQEFCGVFERIAGK